MADRAADIIQDFIAGLGRPPKALSYCDYIADCCRKALIAPGGGIITHVDPIRWDLTEGGAFRSPKKTIQVHDRNGNRYRVTIEDMRDVAKSTDGGTPE